MPVPAPHDTTIDIDADRFLINGVPSYAGRSFDGVSIEGLLMNARFVQAVFDDLNPETRQLWAYPDGPFDAERNTAEFVAQVPAWRRSGLLAFTVNLQGGSPFGYGAAAPWHNSAFTAEGALRPDYCARLARVIAAADAAGMAVILGLFYFGQDHHLADEAAVVRAVGESVDWLCAGGHSNVLIEIANEIGGAMYRHPIIEVGRGDELLRLVRERSAGRVANRAGRLLASTSMMSGHPPGNVLAHCDFVLLHGNAKRRARHLGGMIDTCRAEPAYAGQPLVVNEDDHYDFAQDDNHMLTAVRRRCGWGLFDYRRQGEGFAEGYQCPPVDWSTSSARKRDFFALLERVTGG